MSTDTTSSSLVTEEDQQVIIEDLLNQICSKNSDQALIEGLDLLLLLIGK